MVWRIVCERQVCMWSSNIRLKSLMKMEQYWVIILPIFWLRIN